MLVSFFIKLKYNNLVAHILHIEIHQTNAFMCKQSQKMKF